MATGTGGGITLPIAADSEEMKLFVALPNKREACEPLSPAELQKVEDLMKAYMQDASTKKALPTKA